MHYKQISPKELASLISSHNKDSYCIVDVRAKEKFDQEHIARSVNIPKSYILDEKPEHNETLDQLPKVQEIILTCTTGNSARRCAAILSNQGYQIRLLEGGMTAWNKFKETQ